MKKLIIGIAALLGATTAQASIIPTLVGGPVSVGGGSYSWTYKAELASDQALRNGAYFTLYDVAGFQGFGAMGAGFTGSAQLLGLTPSKVIPSDDPTILNVTFHYSGPDVNYNGTLSERNLGTFEIFSTFGTTKQDDFASEAYRNGGPTKGSVVDTIGTNSVSVPGLVPEPAMWGMMIVGFGMIGVQMRGRKVLGKSVAA